LQHPPITISTHHLLTIAPEIHKTIKEQTSVKHTPVVNPKKPAEILLNVITGNELVA